MEEEKRDSLSFLDESFKRRENEKLTQSIVQ